MRILRWLSNRAKTAVCVHTWTHWERETYSLRGPYGRTDGHLRQVRHCTKCGWSECANVKGAA